MGEHLLGGVESTVSVAEHEVYDGVAGAAAGVGAEDDIDVAVAIHVLGLLRPRHPPLAGDLGGDVERWVYQGEAATLGGVVANHAFGLRNGPAAQESVSAALADVVGLGGPDQDPAWQTICADAQVLSHL